MAALWLGGIAVSLLTTGRYFDVAVRDVAMKIAAFTLARLTEVGVGPEARDRVTAASLFGSYLSALVAQMLPLSPTSLMHAIGVVEMLVGAVILAGYTRLGGSRANPPAD